MYALRKFVHDNVELVQLQKFKRDNAELVQI